MHATSYILSLASPTALILIDELGRGTSPAEGIGIALAISEALAKKRATTFFATHFHQVPQVLEVLPNVAQRQLRVDVTPRTQLRNSGLSNLTFRYRVEEPEAKLLPRYGLEVAQRAGLPPSLVACADRFAAQLESRSSVSAASAHATAAARAMKTLLKVRG
ncbi:unnamed protein product [Parajaminaea phylloscopi]